MLSFVIGVAVAAAGLWATMRWWAELEIVVKGLLPFCVFLAGIVAMIAGLSSLGSRRVPPVEPEKKTS